MKRQWTASLNVVALTQPPYGTSMPLGSYAGTWVMTE